MSISQKEFEKWWEEYSKDMPPSFQEHKMSAWNAWHDSRVVQNQRLVKEKYGEECDP